MLNPQDRKAALEKDRELPVSLQLLLFVDERSSSQEHIRRLHNYLESLKADYTFELEVIEVDKQPHLVEYFRLVATPALVKISPEPKQTLAGSDIVAQLKNCWQQWQQNLTPNELESDGQVERSSSINSIGYSGELIRLSDEIFRLKKEKEELLEQLKFKDQVLAMLAHDLRNPLTAASIALETLEMAHNNPDPEQAQRLKKQIQKQAQSQFRIMNRMITDILQTAKGKSAQLQIQPHKVYLQVLGAEVIAQFRDALQAKSLTLNKDLPQDLPAAYADEELTRQVFVNLLENAVKYTPEGGTIEVSILHRTTQKIQVSICDTGPGIPEEKREQIFEKHVRLKRDEGKEGYGIGLSLCRRVIRAHYGQIWVDSAPNQGSCFHFTLPVYQL